MSYSAENILQTSNSAFRAGWKLGLIQAIGIFQQECGDPGCDVCGEFQKSIEAYIEKVERNERAIL